MSTVSSPSVPAALRRPRLLPCVLCALALLAGCALCGWQLARALAVLERADPALPPLERLVGEWLPAQAFSVDNAVRQGVAGYEHYALLRRDSGPPVLVLLGWSTWPFDAAFARRGTAVLPGRWLAPRPAPWLRLGPPFAVGMPALMNYFDVEAVAARLDGALAPQLWALDDAYGREAVLRGAPAGAVGMHLGYALQWALLAATAATGVWRWRR